MTKVLSALHQAVWGAPALVLILGIGVYLSIRLGLPQIRLFPRAVRQFLRPGRHQGEGVTSYQALCTALAATVGTGNLVGVAGAICLGGPGSIFWMWVCGFVGMATKFAEALLAVQYRKRCENSWLGGPMAAMVSLKTGGTGLARCYCVFGILASFGVGNAAQVNAVVSAVHDLQRCVFLEPCPAGDVLFGIALALVVGCALLGGARRIASAAETLVPIGAGGYLLLCIGALFCNRSAIPAALEAIWQGVWSPMAVTGGVVGSCFQALRIGCARGVFTNEAGMGTAAIAHAAAEVEHPCQQGLMGILEVFLDTIVICTLTALVILTSGVAIPYGQDAGGTLTSLAFARVYGNLSSVFLSAAMILFALATILGWSLYGGRCAQFLFGDRAWKVFTMVQTLLVIPAAVLDTASVWQASELFNGLMAIPNLITLAVLAPGLEHITKEYRKSGDL